MLLKVDKSANVCRPRSGLDTSPSPPGILRITWAQAVTTACIHPEGIIRPPHRSTSGLSISAELPPLLHLTKRRSQRDGDEAHPIRYGTTVTREGERLNWSVVFGCFVRWGACPHPGDHLSGTISRVGPLKKRCCAKTCRGSRPEVAGCTASSI